MSHNFAEEAFVNCGPKQGEPGYEAALAYMRDVYQKADAIASGTSTCTCTNTGTYSTASKGTNTTTNTTASKGTRLIIYRWV